MIEFTGILGLAFFTLSSFSLRESPQDPPRGRKAERHIKMVKVDENGEKVELDTVILHDKIFVWQGDTLDIDSRMKWFPKHLLESDSVLRSFDFQIEMDEDSAGNVFIMRPDRMHQSFVPGFPAPPHAPDVLMLRNGPNANVIDLSDPGIISFKKKKMSGKREKITVIRHEPDEKDVKRVERIIIHDKGNDPVGMDGDTGIRKMMIKISDDAAPEIINEEKKMEIKVEENEKNN
ncbi:MAG: hypothetical protein EOM73_00685 [Bacteroidia bacterium]|nr:hypothetical protein [Bacteroidia bacterium]